MNAMELTPIQQAVLTSLPMLRLPSGARILDAPCGGAAALALALLKRGYQAVGADIERAAAKLLGNAYAEADLNTNLPWDDQSFDAVVSTEGIEHLENHFFFLREMCRILKKGGFIVITTPNIVSLRSRMRFFGSGFFGRDARPLNETARHPLHHIGLATFPELRYEMHLSGFQIVTVRHTHVKPVSYLYSIYVPWMFLYTRMAFRKEKDPMQRRRNKEIFRTLFSFSMLFGESLMLIGKKV
jgi:SAM-dependent methyltransferase